jgi:threonine aldolase
VSPDAGPYLVSTAAVAVENTHNFGGGTVQDYDELRRIRDLTREHALGFHLDGARLANAHIATGIPLADYGRLFDTATLCLSKGLGAPIGTVLVSTADNIARARISRKRFGAGWRQAGILAAAGLYALDHQLARLADDHAAARAFADEVVARVPSAVSEDQVQTNIVVLDTGPCPAAEVAVAAARAGVLVSALGRHVVRAVAHLGVTVEECRAAGAVVGDALSGRAAA